MWSVEEDALRPVSTKDDLALQIPEAGVVNMLRIHRDRAAEVKSRMLSLG